MAQSTDLGGTAVVDAPTLGTSQDPGWLTRHRELASRRAAALGLPTTRDENWRYTDVRGLAKLAVRTANLAAPVDAEELARRAPWIVDATWRWVFVDGALCPKLSRLPPAHVGAMASVLCDGGADEAWLKEVFNEQICRREHFFSSLNTAGFSEATVVRVAADQVIAQPVHIVYVQTEAAAGQCVLPRNLISIGARAKATVVESYVGLSNVAYATVAATECALAQGAKLEHVRVVREGASGLHIGIWDARQGEDSVLRSSNVFCGGALTRSEASTLLAGERAFGQVDGVVVAHGDMHVDNVTSVDHAVPNTRSSETFKHVLSGTARAVFNGRVFVRSVAQKTDALQSNDTLLLSDGAEIDTKPQLEIYADDVRCTHGATVGALDQTALFYLQTRGLGKSQARRLLTEAFVGTVIESLCDEVRAPVQAVVSGELAKAIAHA